MCRLHNLLNIFIFVRFIKNKIFDRKWVREMYVKHVWITSLQSIIRLNVSHHLITKLVSDTQRVK